MGEFQPKTKRELLAYTIAKRFNDTEHLRLYLNSCKKYPLRVVERAFSETKNTVQLKKHPRALFYYLLKKLYANNNQ